MGYFVCAPGWACIDDNIIANDEDEEELVDMYEHEFEQSVDDFLAPPLPILNSTKFSSWLLIVIYNLN